MMEGRFNTIYFDCCIIPTEIKFSQLLIADILQAIHVKFILYTLEIIWQKSQA